MRLGVCIPTIPGREDSLERCIESYRKHTEGVDLVFAIHEDSPSSGEGWMQAAAQLEAGYDSIDLLHLTNDDIECVNDDWWVAASEITDVGALPAPIIYNSDGSIQSAGGQLGAEGDLLLHVGEDGTEVGFTTVPFMDWSQWKRIGMLPVHYASDVWVSERGRQLGIPTLLCHGYELTHHTSLVGRRQDRAAADRATVLAALDE